MLSFFMVHRISSGPKNSTFPWLVNKCPYFSPEMQPFPPRPPQPLQVLLPWKVVYPCVHTFCQYGVILDISFIIILFMMFAYFKYTLTLACPLASLLVHLLLAAHLTAQGRRALSCSKRKTQRIRRKLDHLIKPCRAEPAENGGMEGKT